MRKRPPFTHRISAEPFSVRGMAVITHETTDEEDFVSKNDDSAHGVEDSDGFVRDRASFTHRETPQNPLSCAKGPFSRTVSPLSATPCAEWQ